MADFDVALTIMKSIRPFVSGNAQPSDVSGVSH